MDTVWDGIMKPESLPGEIAGIRQTLADYCRAYDWPHALAILSEHRDFINVSRPGGRSLYAPLHQAAHGGAPECVIQFLVEMGAWRTLQNAKGERAVDIARRRGHDRLLTILEPRLRRQIPIGVLLKIQRNFHAVIRGRAERLIEEHCLRLPDLEPLLEMDKPMMWFPVPGMYGGFSYRLEKAGVEAKLVAESWCRVCEGSGQRHEITSSGATLVAEGFV